jgi:glutamyl-tRNA synthetase
MASVVDDIEMGVTHIVRGADHVTNTATQIQIIRALGGTPPSFAHHSLLTGPGGEALSKRLGTLALRDLRARGIQPMALLSLMARLGSSDPVELRSSIDELAEGFNLSHFGAAPTKFDADDLGPLSARVLHAMPLSAVAAEVRAAGVPDALAAPFWATVRGNVATLAELPGWWEVFAGRAAPKVAPEDEDFVRAALALLPEPPYGPETWSSWTEAAKAATGRKGKGLFMPLRLAVTGRERGPEMAEVMPLLQRKPVV